MATIEQAGIDYRAQNANDLAPLGVAMNDLVSIEAGDVLAREISGGSDVSFEQA
jgi:hypothetical protein